MNYPVIPEDTNELYFQMNGDKDKGLSYLNAIKGSFNLHRETDNKKSWVSTDSDVEHEDQNLDTSYTALGDRMIINCKEYCFVINRQKILDIYAEENNGVVDPLFEEIVDQQIKRIEEIYIPFVKKHLIPATAIEQCEPNFIIMDLSMSKVDQTHNCVEDGEATVTITGGVPPFTYLWSNGGTGDTITGLAEGEYSVTVTDSTGTSISGSVTINKLFDAPTLTGSISEITSSSMKVIPAGGTGPYTYEWFKGGDCEPECDLILSLTSNNVSCNGASDGNISVSVTGGSGNYSYLWSNGGMSDTISNLSPGTYTVSVTDIDNPTCIKEITGTITQPTIITGEMVDITTNSMRIVGSGGVGPYTYEWSNGQTSSTAIDLTPDTEYNVIIIDSNGCTSTISGRTLEEETTPFQMTFRLEDNDSITLPTISTGNYDYTVDWGDGNSDTITTWNDPNRTHNYVTAGDYQVSITGLYDRQSFLSVPISKDKIISVDNFGDVGWVTFKDAFRNCTNLTNIAPIYKFDGTNMEYMFGGCGLTTIPAGLFDNCPNVTSFNSTFQVNILTSIPSGLFDNCPNVVDFSNTFTNNHSTSNLKTIPAGLFDNCPNVTSFNSTFQGNILTSIPSGLFDNCPNVTDFTQTFSDNNLSSIPSGLFDNCPNVIDFGFIFSDNNLSSIPSGLFDNCPNVTRFNGAFWGNTTLTGEAPELWTRTTPGLTGGGCFRACTGLNNYNSIPQDWK